MAKSFGPCNPNSSVGPCCELYKQNPDVCTDTGLCVAQEDGYQGYLYQNGCTDKTWGDDACPHFCKSMSLQPTRRRTNLTLTFPAANSTIRSMDVLPCGRGVFCCTPYNSGINCCDDKDSRMTTSMGRLEVTTPKTAAIGGPGSSSTTPTSSASVGASSSANPSSGVTCPKDNTAVVGGAVGGVLGAALLGALAALAIVLFKRRGAERSPEYRPVDVTQKTDQQCASHSQVVHELPVHHQG